MKVSLVTAGTVLYCRRWGDCVAFYRDTLGFPVVWENDLFVEVAVTATARLGLIDVSRTKKQVTPSDAIVLSFRVPNVRETYRVLRRTIPELTPPTVHPWGVPYFELRDPDGRVVEFWEGQDDVSS